jgi:hypothetical protein
MIKIERIADWLVRQLSDAQRYVLRSALIAEDYLVERKTEKAVKVRFFDRDIGSFSIWIPLSAINPEPTKWEIEKAKKEEERFNKYLDLIAWAKEKGIIGVREKMKKSTVISKIEEAGLEVPKDLI